MKKRHLFMLLFAMFAFTTTSLAEEPVTDNEKIEINKEEKAVLTPVPIVEKIKCNSEAPDRQRDEEPTFSNQLGINLSILRVVPDGTFSSDFVRNSYAKISLLLPDVSKKRSLANSIKTPDVNLLLFKTHPALRSNSLLLTANDLMLLNYDMNRIKNDYGNFQVDKMVNFNPDIMKGVSFNSLTAKSPTLKIGNSSFQLNDGNNIWSDQGNVIRKNWTSVQDLNLNHAGVVTINKDFKKSFTLVGKGQVGLNWNSTGNNDKIQNQITAAQEKNGLDFNVVQNNANVSISNLSNDVMINMVLQELGNNDVVTIAGQDHGNSFNNLTLMRAQISHISKIYNSSILI